MSVLEQDSVNLDALWNASFMASTMGVRAKAPDQALSRLGRELASRALRHWPERPEARFVWAVSLAMEIPKLKANQSIEASRELRRRIAATLEKDADHPGAWYLLGRWRMAYATLNPFKKLAVKTLLGGFPKEATLEGAQAAFRKAIAARPLEPLYHLDLARTLVEQERKDEAIQVLAKAQYLAPRSGDDPANLETIRTLLGSLRD